MDTRHIEALPAPDILAPHRIITSHHVALRLGEPCFIAVICSTRQLCLLPPHNPLHLVLARLPAVRTGHRVGTRFWSLVKKIALFHQGPSFIGGP